MISPTNIAATVTRCIADVADARVRLHGTDACYFSAMYRGKALVMLVDRSMVSVYGPWTDQGISLYIVKHLGRA
jgi:hypothetical protein